MDLQHFEKLKEKLEKAEQEYQEINGRINQIQDDLKKEFDTSNMTELKEIAVKLKKEVDTASELIEKEMEDLGNLIDDMEAMGA